MNTANMFYLVEGVYFIHNPSEKDKLYKIKSVFKCDESSAKAIVDLINKNEDICASHQEISLMRSFGIKYRDFNTEQQKKVREKKEELEWESYRLESVKKELAQEWFNKLSAEDKEWAKEWAKTKEI